MNVTAETIDLGTLRCRVFKEKNKKFNPANREPGLVIEGEGGVAEEDHERGRGPFFASAAAHPRGGHTGGATTEALDNPGGHIARSSDPPETYPSEEVKGLITKDDGWTYCIDAMTKPMRTVWGQRRTDKMK
jgi:hypothetical protein